MVRAYRHSDSFIIFNSQGPSSIGFYKLIVILTLSNSKVCEGIDPSTDRSAIGDFCSHSFLRGFVRAYSIIVGDIELTDYRESPLITVLWTFFTLFGVIILLNVLIAIVTDSYER